eukprot:14540099-Alexandrium_andersonii.AAC.1
MQHPQAAPLWLTANAMSTCRHHLQGRFSRTGRYCILGAETDSPRTPLQSRCGESTKQAPHVKPEPVASGPSMTLVRQVSA